MHDLTLYHHLPIAASELMPHRGRMLLIGELAGCEGDVAHTELVVSDDNPFVGEDGRLETLAMVELLAQLSAAQKGYRAKLEGRSASIGYLVGVKDFEILRPVAAGDRLRLEIRRTFSMGQVSLVDGEIKVDGAQPAARGTLKLWEEETLPEPPVPTADGPRLETPEASPAAAGPESGCGALKRSLQECVREFQAKGGRRVEAEIVFERSFAGFEGHFPGFPILPGVVMLQLGCMLVGMARGQAMEIAHVGQAKFSGMVFPGDAVRLTANLDGSGDDVQATARIVRHGSGTGEDTVANMSFSARGLQSPGWREEEG
jgi:3-hydroxyacyl-[acyl-carrier-protein] dehydratase